jgi:hypothetical protein
MFMTVPLTAALNGVVSATKARTRKVFLTAHFLAGIKLPLDDRSLRGVATSTGNSTPKTTVVKRDHALNGA